MDIAKYRTLFLEEATEHLAEIGQALLVLEKDLRADDALDTVFRLMHSMKGMGASLGYDAVSLLTHRLEDRLGNWKKQGGIDGPEGVALLFRGLGLCAADRRRARGRRLDAARRDPDAHARDCRRRESPR